MATKRKCKWINAINTKKAVTETTMLWLEGIYDTQFDIFESIGKKVFYLLAVTTPLHSKVSIVCTILNQFF